MSDKRTYHIMVIDDDEDDYFIIKDLCSEITSSQVKVDWVGTYDEGIKAVTDCKYDIFFIDYLLGAKTGLELVEHAIKINCPSPVVMLTGFADGDLDRKAIRAGASDYLPKSQLTSDILERTIRHSIERFQQKQVVHQQQAKFQALFEQSLDGIFILDKDWKVIDINESFIYLFKLRSDQFGKSLKNIIVPPKESERFEILLEQAGTVDNYPVTIDQGADAINLLVSCSTVKNIQGEITGYQGIIRDITKFKEAEREIAQAERFQLSGRMARIIAHEIRNPLSNITLSSEYLIELGREDEDTFNTYVDIIKRNSKRISNLIDGLLNSTKSTDLNIETFSPEKVVYGALEMCEDRLKLKGVRIEEKPCADVLEMRGDEEKVKLVLVNIITNAIEAMEEVDDPALTLSCFKHDDFTVISIGDNGKGMDEQTKERLFDPFFTSRHGGMGLGLSAVQHLVNQHRGLVHVESEVGAGTTFQLHFPQ